MNSMIMNWMPKNNNFQIFRFSVMALFGAAFLFSIPSSISKSATAQVVKGSVPPGYCAGPTDEIVPCDSIHKNNPNDPKICDPFGRCNPTSCDPRYCDPVPPPNECVGITGTVVPCPDIMQKPMYQQR